MLEFHVLSGRQAGSIFTPNSFPCWCGRSPDAALRLEDPGVWDQHLEFDLMPEEGAVVRLCPPAMATLNGAPVNEAHLRNGDRIELGSISLQFWLSAPIQQTFLGREVLTWAGLGLLCLLQAALILWLTV